MYLHYVSTVVRHTQVQGYQSPQPSSQGTRLGIEIYVAAQGVKLQLI